MVRVVVADETKARRIPRQAEIWFRGHGSVFLDKTCDRLRNGSMSCGQIDLGMRPVGQVLDLFVYLNGRKLDASGREADEIKAAIKLTPSMCRPGCDLHMIWISIYDTEVEVTGSPVAAQHGKGTLTFKRR